jgi:hypothetical protein
MLREEYGHRNRKNLRSRGGGPITAVRWKRGGTSEWLWWDETCWLLALEVTVSVRWGRERTVSLSLSSLFSPANIFSVVLSVAVCVVGDWTRSETMHFWVVSCRAENYKSYHRLRMIILIICYEYVLILIDWCRFKFHIILLSFDSSSKTVKL